MPVDLFFYKRLSMSLNFRGHHRPCSRFSDTSLGGWHCCQHEPRGQLQARIYALLSEGDLGIFARAGDDITIAALMNAKVAYDGRRTAFASTAELALKIFA
jgi:hypothetical protein